jgi:hypothetical protein
MYKIRCGQCNNITTSLQIIDLLNNTNEHGLFICKHGHTSNTFIHRKVENLQEKDQIWDHCITGIIPIDYKSETYFPYGNLIADADDNGQPLGKATHFQPCYFKDTRQFGGSLKHGHGPGGPPVFAISHIFTILERLILLNLITKEELAGFLESINPSVANAPLANLLT